MELDFLVKGFVVRSGFSDADGLFELSTFSAAAGLFEISDLGAADLFEL